MRCIEFGYAQKPSYVHFNPLCMQISNQLLIGVNVDFKKFKIDMKTQDMKIYLFLFCTPKLIA